MIWVIIIIALVLRLICLNQSLWLDEAINVLSAKNLDLISFVIKYPIGDYHPPGYFALLWIWTHIFGFSEIIVRLPSVLFGIGTVILTYLLGKNLFNKKTGIFAGLLLAVSPISVYYSQEARMYSFATFAVLLFSYFFIQLLNGKKWSYLGYILGGILVLYSDYVAYLIFPVHFLFLLITKRSLLIKWLSAVAISLLIFLPWINILIAQISEGMKAKALLPGWSRVAGGADVKNIALVPIKFIFGRISFDNKILYGLLSTLFIFMYGFIILQTFKKWNKNILFLCTWILLPFFLVIFISFFIPFLSYFRLIFILPPLFILVGRGLDIIPNKISKILLAILVLTSLTFLLIYYLNPKFQREDWRGATLFLDNIKDNNSIILFEDNHIEFPFIYYKKDLSNSFAGLKNIEAKNLNDVNDIENLLANIKEIYIFEYLVEITDPKRLLEEKVKLLGFKKVNVYNFNGVGLLLFYQK